MPASRAWGSVSYRKNSLESFEQMSAGTVIDGESITARTETAFTRPLTRIIQARKQPVPRACCSVSSIRATRDHSPRRPCIQYPRRRAPIIERLRGRDLARRPRSVDQCDRVGERAADGLDVDLLVGEDDEIADAAARDEHGAVVGRGKRGGDRRATEPSGAGLQLAAERGGAS